MKLVFPAGWTSYNDINGNVWTPDANGELTLPSIIDPSSFIEAGFTEPAEQFGSTRPATPYPGQEFYDVTLYGGVGGPIWRNAANSGWVNAAGNAV